MKFVGRSAIMLNKHLIRASFNSPITTIHEYVVEQYILLSSQGHCFLILLHLNYIVYVIPLAMPE